MNKQELKFILQSNEGLKTEFKENISGIDKEIVAFANAEGGRIFVGITDKSETKGIKITNKLKSEIQDIARNCDPSIEINLEEFENILIIEIKESLDKPHKCSSGFYLRQGANSQKMNRDEILDFAIGEGRIRFDEQINKEFDFEKDFDEEKLNVYLKEAGLTKNLGNESALVNLGVAKKIGGTLKFNNAGILFFAKKPSKFFLVSKVVCAEYQTNEKVNILDRKIYDDGILENIKQAINFVKRRVKVEFEIKTAERKEIPQYPEQAYREIIVNAIMHRDYFDKSSDVLIEVYKNKLAVFNPGGLVKWLKINEFGKVSKTRNSIIALLLSKTIFVEKLGTGIKRINDAMNLAKLPKPSFEFYEHSFYATLSDKTYFKKEVGEKVGKKVGKNEAKILSLISKNKDITYVELSNKLNITEKSIYMNVEKLKAKGLLKRIGPAKGGYWEVIK